MLKSRSMQGQTFKPSWPNFVFDYSNYLDVNFFIGQLLLPGSQILKMNFLGFTVLLLIQKVV